MRRLMESPSVPAAKRTTEAPVPRARIRRRGRRRTPRRTPRWTRPSTRAPRTKRAGVAGASMTRVPVSPVRPTTSVGCSARCVLRVMGRWCVTRAHASSHRPAAPTTVMGAVTGTTVSLEMRTLRAVPEAVSAAIVPKGRPALAASATSRARTPVTGAATARSASRPTTSPPASVVPKARRAKDATLASNAALENVSRPRARQPATAAAMAKPASMEMSSAIVVQAERPARAAGQT